MLRPHRLFLALAAVFAISAARPALAQTRTTAPSYSASAPSPEDTANTQQQLIKLLRLSPTLTSVVARDPSLLADQAYVSRSNPELAQFLVQHPEVTRNPEFYLFSNLGGNGRDRDKALERAVWPDFVQPERREEMSETPEIMNKLAPILVFPCLFAAIVLIVRYFIESRRSSRFYKMQSDLHMRLIDKLGTNQELAAYFESEAGKRLFASAPAALELSRGPAVPNVVGRVLTPLQIGFVLTLLGAGLLMLPRQGQEMTSLVFGIVLLMPGIGFILSAVATWVLAHRLGLMPARVAAGGADAAIPGGNGGMHDGL